MATDHSGEISGTDCPRIAGHWLSGVAAVTALTGQDRPTGVTMNTVAPLSRDPPQFLIDRDPGSETLAAISASRRFCINVLRADQHTVSGCLTRRGADTFAKPDDARGKLAMPVIEGCIAQAGCVVLAIHDSGDHAIGIGRCGVTGCHGWRSAGLCHEFTWGIGTMYVTFDGGTPRLLDSDNFRALKVVVAAGQSPALDRVGRVDGDHVWLERAWLEANGRPDDPAWASGFAGMAAYAAKSGWVDDRGAIRAHIETIPA